LMYSKDNHNQQIEALDYASKIINHLISHILLVEDLFYPLS
jgi:hypothetical protein